MSRQKTNLMLNDAICRMAAPESLQGLFHEHEEGYPLPSSESLEEIIQLARAILFPGYFGKSQVNIHTIIYQIGVNVEQMYLDDYERAMRCVIVALANEFGTRKQDA